MTSSKRADFASFILAEEEERRALAADLHDGPTQSCVAAILRLQVMSRKSKSAEFDPVLERMNSTLEELRKIEYRLSPITLYDFGLIETLDRFVKGFAQDLGWSLDLDLPSAPLELDRALEFSIFRILQYVLERRCHHHKIDSLAVSLAREGDEVKLQIACHCSKVLEDSDEDVPLDWLDTRVAALGGRSELQVEPKGMKLVLGFPCPKGES